MKVTAIAVDAIEISPAEALDTIHVFWVNVKPGQGYATIICFGSAWTVYFGGMGPLTIQQFFGSTSLDYLVAKMHSPILKEGKKYDAYLTRIISAVQQALKLEAA